MSVQATIEQVVRQELQPEYLELVNESDQHNVPEGSESHFKLTLVSADFAGVSRVRRHQQVYRVLQEQLAGPVHALAIHAYSTEEWAERSGAPASPRCLGGEQAPDGND